MQGLPKHLRFLLFLRFLLPAALLGSFGCGHPATEAECQLIVDRNVELTMKAKKESTPDEIEKEKARVRGEMAPVVKECVGRRITDGTVACVKAAQTVKQVDQCLR